MGYHVRRRRRKSGCGCGTLFWLAIAAVAAAIFLAILCPGLATSLPQAVSLDPKNLRVEPDKLNFEFNPEISKKLSSWPLPAAAQEDKLRNVKTTIVPGNPASSENSACSTEVPETPEPPEETPAARATVTKNSTSTSTTAVVDTSKTFCGDRAYEILKQVLEHTPCQCGSPAEDATFAWLKQQVEERGYEAKLYKVPFKDVKLWMPTLDKKTLQEMGLSQTTYEALVMNQVKDTSYNYPAGGTHVLWVGSSKNPKNILLAHPDTYNGSVEVPMGDPTDKNTQWKKEQVKSPGANDNGSGVAVLLHLLEVVDIDELNTVIVFPGCEESGLIGSNWASNHLPLPQTAIAVDMVGYRHQESKEFGPSTTLLAMMFDKKLGEDLAKFAPLECIVRLDSGEPVLGTSDDWSYTLKGIKKTGAVVFRESRLDGDFQPRPDQEKPLPYPVVDENQHRNSDTIDRIDPEALEIIGRWIERWLEEGR